ncbi:alpha/beta fold hydrolase [Glaciimonas sp. GG7]
MPSSSFFPLQSPFHQDDLDVGHGHRLWYAQYGNPDGIPLLWLHGGPGSASSVRHQMFADPARYRLVLCDQRGCGLSTPSGSTEYNDTGRLIEDIEGLRRHLGLGKILLGGGSWGACLALAFAQRHPLSLQGLVLRAPFLAGRGDIDRFFQPDPASASAAWHAFASHAPASERAHFLRYLADTLAADSPHTAALAQAWHLYEQRLEQPDIGVAIPATDIEKLVARYRIQAHYLRHNCFLNSADLLQAAADVSGFPVALLHGAHDLICNPENAISLHARIAVSCLSILPGAGHDPFHPTMAKALLDALNCFAEDGDFARCG